MAAAALVEAIHRNRNGLTDEARVVLMRVCSGHERRTVALLTKAEAAVNVCGGVHPANVGPHPGGGLPGWVVRGLRRLSGREEATA